MVVDNAAFTELMRIAGWSGKFDDEVTITGQDPVLPTSFHVGEMTAGIHAAIGVAINNLWELKTGRRQQVAVDVRDATATVLSVFNLKIDGKDPPRGQPMAFSPGYYQTRDERWVYVYTYEGQRMLKLLGCEKNPGSVPDAVASWDAQALEDTIAEEGLCGAMVRSGDEWAKHPQGKILQQLPVVEVIKIGNSPPEPLPPGSRPLSGIRVLDPTIILAGPTCARTLAEHGADVLKIGSPSRQDGPGFDMDTGHGKRSTYLNLKEQSDKERLWKLIREADVFSQSYRYGALASLGFSPEALARVRPGIIYTSVNCYGHEGPWRERRGWEPMAQTVSGIAYEQGDGGKPEMVHAAIDDYPTGYEAAFGTLVALERRAREGGSYLVRVSLTQNAMWLYRLGRVAKEKWQGLDRHPPAEEIKRLSVNTETVWGRLTHMAPVLKLSETPPHWTLPAAPLGTHQPVWLDR
jgi:crotonobetainyl-CoA:carnitine CoA-transferase CaiB-like acyl-CoA transferase